MVLDRMDTQWLGNKKRFLDKIDINAVFALQNQDF